MLISLENAGECYTHIVKKVKYNNGKIIIFVGFDIDSLCTLRILITLLRGDNVRYEIIPLMNNDQLEFKISDLEKSYYSTVDVGSGSKDIKAIIMINCGGNMDISHKWFADSLLGIICLIIDVRRPIKHRNLNSLEIAFLDDGKFDTNNCPSNEDFDNLDKKDGEEEENYPNDENKVDSKYKDEPENENEDKKEAEDQNITYDKNHRRLIKKKENLDTINEEEESDEIDNILGDKKPKKYVKSNAQNRHIYNITYKRKVRAMANAYYSGNYFGYPSAYIMYKIASSLHREDSQILWLFIVSSTEHYLQSHISTEMYEDIYNQCHKEVIRFNLLKPNDSFINRNLKKEEKQTEESSKLIEDKYDYADVRVKTVNKEVKSIILEPDYRLYLFRHWNLFDSLIYSNYTLARLVTWKEQGKEEIKKLLTFIGIPLDEAKLKYTYMKNDFKNLFKEKIISTSKSFDLKDLLFNSFLYQFNQKTQLSASDFANCLSAILDYPYKIEEIDGNSNEDEGDSTSCSNKDESEGSDNIFYNINYIKDEKLMRSHYKYDNFWAAYDFVSLKNINMVKIAIELAIKFQIALVTQGTLLIDKKSIATNKYFRYAIISNELEEKKYFYHPICLEKLCLFIQEVSYECFLKTKNLMQKPFVLCVYNNDSKSYLVAGVLGTAKSYEEDRNDFSNRFRLTAKEKEAKLILNNFDDSIVEIPIGYFTGFMEIMSEL